MATPILPKRDGIYWRVRVRRPAQGVQISERFRTEREAQRYIDTTVMPLLSKGEIPLSSNSRRVTFEQLADSYLDLPALTDQTGRRALKPSSQIDRRVRLKALKAIFGPYKLSVLTPRVIERLIEAQGWSAQNRQKYESALNQLFEWGRTPAGGEVVAANPMRGVRRTRGSSRKLKRVYTAAEWSALLASADAETVPIGTFLRLLRATGCRKSELRSLQWADLQPSNREGLGASLYIRDPKSREPRTVFIRPAEYQLLNAHEKEHRRPDEPRVFTLKVDPVFRKVRAAAGLEASDNGEHLTIHAIRRTFATELGARGATLAQMRAAGGWKTAEQAMRYMQVTDDLAAEAALLVGGGL